ncbi:MAG: hypothetical protein PVG89_18170, partial [Gammaproteobacteria bacterium]
MHKDTCIIYRIDKDGIIVFVSDNWNRFALANNGADLLERAVLNRSLFDFITDWQSRHLYELLIDYATRKSCPIIFPYRCDAPALRRFMTMEIVPLENGLTEFRSCIVKEQSRDAQPVLDHETPRSDEFLLICAWCKKVNTQEGQWEEIEETVKTKNL